jgi:3-oxoacyl-[acyl-carrier protein] reductase
MATPDDVAEAIVWLVDGARVVTGELIMLDSGRHLGKG